ncbi:hypothetical protein T492DRAFT_884788, partial [Pavlovales sp. CCMP2436]
LSAHSDEHSFNPRWVDMDHAIEHFSFGVPDQGERARHAREIKQITDAQIALAVHDKLAGDGVLPSGEIALV